MLKRSPQLAARLLVALLVVVGSRSGLLAQAPTGSTSQDQGSQQFQTSGSLGEGKTFRGARSTARDDKGGVIGTKVVFYSFPVSYDIGPVGKDFKKVDTIVCGNFCKKRVHSKHEECNLDCDEPCKASHHVHMLGRYDWDEKVEERIQKAVNGVATSSGEAPIVPFYALRDVMNRISDQAEVDFAVPHIAAVHDKPCTIEEDQYGLRRWPVRITVRTVMETYLTIGDSANAKITKTDGPTWTEEIGGLWIPDKTPVKGEPKVVCACTPPEAPKTTTGTAKGTPTFSGISATCSFFTAGGGYLGSDPPEGVSLKFTGIDMTSLQCTIENHSDQAFVFRVQPGTLFIPDDKKIQWMISIAKLVQASPAAGSPAGGGGVTPSWGGGSSSWGGAPIRKLQDSGAQKEPSVSTFSIHVRCLDMGKKEPVPASAFAFIRGDDEGLTDLAELSANTHYRAAMDQARYWILRDQATYSSMHERLAPPISAEHYVQALYDVGHYAHADVSAAAFHKCFDPALVLEPNASADARNWYLASIIRLEPDALAATVRGDAAKRLAALGDNPGTEVLRPYAEMARRLCGSDNAELRRAGLSFLSEGVPQARRADLVALGALDTLPSILADSASADLPKALDVADAYAYAPAIDAVKALEKGGPTDEVRTKAASVSAHLAPK